MLVKLSEILFFLTGDNDVTFDVVYCGICHTDVHFANNSGIQDTHYPFVPGQFIDK